MQPVIRRYGNALANPLCTSDIEELQQHTALPERTQLHIIEYLERELRGTIEVATHLQKRSTREDNYYMLAHHDTIVETERKIYNLLTFALITKNTTIAQWFIKWMHTGIVIDIEDTINNMFIHLLAYDSYDILFQYPYSCICANNSVYRCTVIKNAMLYHRKNVLLYFE